MKYVRKTISVLVAGAFTALAVYGGVSLAGATSLTTGVSNEVAMSSTSTGVQSTANSTAGSGTLTCPATGCTASSCHATQGGGRGGW